ncbi:Armadillo-type fold [Arabidopsis thaliana x Arabidopsis arenosa]|uniref:Armadillo-type fold n=1 Tax=Arabidopsis thaliana x Arabidopsis arenosa TaxID=1240361 RepID=A0A8T1Y9X1_9BRAS|nr:Armadillo-type fold [Arabidopsis thaliana x Arabidopsis arenosa]
MAESLNLQLKARDILVSQSHEELAKIVDHLFKRQEYKTARVLYDLCVSCNPGCLTLKLLKLYQSSSNDVTRFRSIYLLSKTLTDFRNRNFELSRDSLYEIKTLLISCLTMKETKESDIKILRKIVYFVAYNVVLLHDGKWDELGDCILTLANSKEPVKAFHVFIDLPPVYKSFIDKFLHKVLEEASNVFLYPYRVGDWSLALQTFVKMWIQLLSTGMRFELLKALMEIRVSSVVNSVIELVNKEKEQFLVQGLEDFERFFSRDMNLYRYDTDQCYFVSALVIKIEGVGSHLTKDIVRKIKMLFTELDNPTINPQDDDLKNCREEFDRGWYDHLKNLSSLEVLKIFASTELEDRSREIAIRRVNALLSDHTLKKVKIDIAEMRELQPLLMSCLKEEGISYSMFKVLGQVVNYVAYEMLVYQDETCYELRDYIASSKTEFRRAVYIFQCLTMALVDDDFVIPVMEKLFPEIITRLDPPTELLVDNSCWVLVFKGAFCAAIHLIEDLGYAKSVKEIAHKMIDSIKELVGREMEVGLVRRAFRDVESIVKKQLEWYSTSQYKFVKGLLWRLYAIKGMKWESKIVLWRINVIVERRVKEVEKELPETEFDWLNLTDDEFQ